MARKNPLAEMLRSGFGADVLIELSPPEMSLNMHSSVLGCACPYFKRLFSDDARPRPDGKFRVTELAGFDAVAVTIFLVDMYGLRADPDKGYEPSDDEQLGISAGTPYIGLLYDVGRHLEMPLPPYVRYGDPDAYVHVMSNGSGLHFGDGGPSYAMPIDAARDRQIVVDYVVNKYNATLHARVLSDDGVAALNAWLGRDMVSSLELVDTDQWDTNHGAYTYVQCHLKINGRVVWHGKRACHLAAKSIGMAKAVEAFLSDTVVNQS